MQAAILHLLKNITRMKMSKLLHIRVNLGNSYCKICNLIVGYRGGSRIAEKGGLFMNNE